MFQFGLNQHLFSKLNPLFVFSISVVKLINQFFDLCDRPAFKMNIYHKLKVSCSIRLVIIKHVLDKRVIDTSIAKWWYKTLIKMHFYVLITPSTSLLLVPSNQSVKIKKQFASSTKQCIYHSTSINLSK